MTKTGFIALALSTTFLTSAWAQSTVSVPVGANTEVADGTTGRRFRRSGLLDLDR